jgi:hypothetical protein
VQQYLDRQGLAPYLAMADRYGDLYDRMLEILEYRDEAEAERRAELRAEFDELNTGTLSSPFLDVDATVRSHCARLGLPVPADVDALIELHIQAVEAWLASLAA